VQVSLGILEFMICEVNEYRICHYVQHYCFRREPYRSLVRVYDAASYMVHSKTSSIKQGNWEQSIGSGNTLDRALHDEMNGRYTFI